jgi:hypothetical protein
MKKIIIISFVFFGINACQNNSKTEEKIPIEESKPSLSDQIVGEWRNIDINVTIKTETGDSILDVPESKWEEILNIRPIITNYNEDGTYTSEYRTLTDEVMMTTSGYWKVIGDSLQMTERDVPNYYYAEMENGIVKFTGYLDWDGDGENDDLYIGRQKKN